MISTKYTYMLFSYDLCRSIALWKICFEWWRQRAKKGSQKGTPLKYNKLQKWLVVWFFKTNARGPKVMVVTFLFSIFSFVINHQTTEQKRDFSFFLTHSVSFFLKNFYLSNRLWSTISVYSFTFFFRFPILFSTKIEIGTSNEDKWFLIFNLLDEYEHEELSYVCLYIWGI